MKNRSLATILAAMWLLSAAALFSAESPLVEIEIVVRQKPMLLDKYFEIVRDTVEAPVGKKLLVSLVNFSLDLRVEKADSQAVEFTAHLVTYGSNPYNFANRFKIEYGLPARIENIPGKGNSFYQILLSPRKITDDVGISCQFDPDLSGQFNVDPTNNFDIYYIKYSLADYHWNNIKNYLEAEFTRFREAFELAAPGKMNLYLCPCPVPTVHWDKRFGYMIDPGRSNIYTIYTHEYKSVDALLPNMLRLMRLWGYAPPFLIEGLAGYFEFSGYEMKKLRRDGKIPSVKNMLTASSYYQTEPKTAETVAASFVKFLTDTQGPAKIKQWYQAVDDLNIYREFETIYGQPLDSLEQHWLEYIDTLTLERRLFDFYASRAGSLYRTDQQINYLEEMSRLDRTIRDSLETWSKLAPVYYQNGNYYQAEKGYRILLTHDPKQTAFYYLVLGNLQLIDGNYGVAYRLFDSALIHDSAMTSVRLPQARILALRGDTLKAIQMVEDNLGSEKSPAARIEYLLFLGKLRGTRGANFDSTASQEFYTDAVAWATELASKSPDDPTNKLRLGLAYFGLKEWDKARELLELANFIDNRPYYQCEALLALGNLYDLKKEYETARDHYRKVLALPAAVFQREQAQQNMETPFRY